jgi:ADP-ribosylglycohydrolase/protein-tyrosine phosphatase
MNKITASTASLYALAMGDAYGVGFEFLQPGEIAKKYPYPPATSIGGGDFDFAPGEFSDDTEMTVLTLASLQREGDVDIVKIKQLYTLWAHIAKDIGFQTRAALIDDIYDLPGEGNGALMRILPVAAYMHNTLAWDIAKIRNEISHISALTHDNYTIHAINNFFIDLMFGLSIESHSNLIDTFNTTSGNNAWVMNTARIVYEVYQRGNIPLMDGFWKIIKYGGDTDTACAIYGALRGYQNPALVSDDLLEKLLSHDSLKQLQQLPSTELYTYVPEPTQALLVAGQYPGSRGRITHTLKMAGIVNLEIDTIINLMELDELERFTPYQKALKHVIQNLKIHHLPIRDMDIPDDQTLQRILDTMENDIENAKRVYVHCWGGHGRTGTVIGSWLVKEGMNAEEALDKIKKQRLLTSFGDAPSPQTPEQIDVIKRLSITLGRE